jgi:hypothetical protein
MVAITPFVGITEATMSRNLPAMTCREISADIASILVPRTHNIREMSKPRRNEKIPYLTNKGVE